MDAKKLATAAKINSTCFMNERVICHCYFFPYDNKWLEQG